MIYSKRNKFKIKFCIQLPCPFSVLLSGIILQYLLDFHNLETTEDKRQVIFRQSLSFGLSAVSSRMGSYYTSLPYISHKKYCVLLTPSHQVAYDFHLSHYCRVSHKLLYWTLGSDTICCVGCSGTLWVGEHPSSLSTRSQSGKPNCLWLKTTVF